MATYLRRARPCEVCGQDYRPNDYRQRTCGRYCGAILRGVATSCQVHWRQCLTCEAWYTGRTRHCPPPAKDMSWMARVIECPVCGQGFTNPHTTIAVHCSKRCSRKAGKLRRKVRECGSQGEWRWSDFMRIAARFDYRCAYCGIKPDRLDPDHVIPLARGGPNVVGNLLPACPPCNHHKTDSPLDEWAERRARNGQSPRCTTWDDDDPRYFHLTAVRSGERAGQAVG